MMTPLFTEFAIVRPKSPTARALIYRKEQDEVEYLDDYTLVGIIESTNSINIRTLEEDEDLSNYVFCGTRFGRDEYCHKDDFNKNMEIYIQNSINHLTKKLNLL